MSLLTAKQVDKTHKFLNESGLFDSHPESWHKITMKMSDVAEKSNYIIDSIGEVLYLEDKSLQVEVGNMTFKNPVGLSAGFAKQTHGLKLWEAFGFGYITIGGITANAQSGNLQPRIFRFPEESSVVNGMGLPGDGIDAEVNRLKMRKQLGMMPKVPLIANLCNSATTTTEDSKIDEFKLLMEKLYPYMDGFEINISCPNQGGVCDIMKKEAELKKLLTVLKTHNESLALRNGGKRKTLIVKIAPLTKHENEPEKIKDLTMEGLNLIARVCNEVGIDAVTATNTSQEHNFDTKIIKPDGGIIRGGMSGLRIKEQSLKTVQRLRGILDKNIPIIGVGGIGYDNGQSGVDILKAGAVSIEILSSFVQNSVATPYHLKKAILENFRTI